MVPASGVAVFGPLRFRAGRACYVCALGRSYFGRAAAPRALGPSIMPPAWTVPALPGLAMPSGACARSSRVRWSWSASAWAGAGPCSLGDLRPPWPVPPGRITWSAAARPACRLPPPAWPCLAPRLGEVPRRGGEGPPPSGPRDLPPCFRPGFSPVTRATGFPPLITRGRAVPRVTRVQSITGI